MSSEDNGTIEAMRSKLNSMDKVNADLSRKKAEVQQHRIEADHERVVKSRQEIDRLSNISIDFSSPEEVNKIKQSSTNYLKSAKASKVFLVNAFKKIVTYAGGHIILVAAPTGGGKSTTCANLIYKAATQGQKVLVLSNEEKKSDIYNRVTCLIRGIPYTDHGNFSEKEMEMFEKSIEALSSRIKIIDDGELGTMGATTSIEGMEGIFKNLLKPDAPRYDAIIVDYYQNVESSLLMPELGPYEVQHRFAKLLDKFKGLYGAPIVVLAQKKQNTEENAPFKEKLEGRKTIANISTCILEADPEYDKIRTSWKVVKSRFNSDIGKTVYTGYKHGLYVDYDLDFQEKSDRIILERQLEANFKKGREIPKDESEG